MNKSLENLISKLVISMDDEYPNSLFHGKMGGIIYFYHLSKTELYKNKNYQLTANHLLNSMLEDGLSIDHSISVEDGLAGIGIGITHLIKNQFIAGNPNELLEDIDSIVYRKVVFSDKYPDFSSNELLYLIYYLNMRLLDQTEINMQILFQDLIIKALNDLFIQINDDFLNEPFTFSIYHYQLPVFLWVLSKLIKSDFYNYKIVRIVDELRTQILSRFPLLHSNRLFLLWGILHLTPYLRDRSWLNYVKILHHEINLNEILKEEMCNRKIFISNGISMIYLLLNSLNNKFPEYRIAFDPQKIYDKIISSEAWKMLIKREDYYQIHQGLINGFPGVHLVLLHIKQNYL